LVDISNRKKFFVIGMGKSGRAVARLLADKGFNVAVFDDDASVLGSVLESTEFEGLGHSIEVAAGESVLGSLIQSDCVVVSPGVSLEHPLVRKARADGIETIGELEVAYHFCAAEIIGVTGTNGKSTVVSLLGDIFKAAERRYAVGGNIGTPLSSIPSGQVRQLVRQVCGIQIEDTQRGR
jgi:UDP-N-acetylmuramoylalanine--D-glutamate ligase